MTPAPAGAAAAGRPSVAARFAHAYADVVHRWPAPSQQLPIVYSEDYNISLFGIEKLHPFDAAKFRRVRPLRGSAAPHTPAPGSRAPPASCVRRAPPPAP